MGIFSKIKEGLKKTRDAIVGRIDEMLKSFTKIDDDLFEELEELLVMGDVGIRTAEKICDELRARVKKEGITEPTKIHGLLSDVISEMLRGGQELNISTKPSVILVIGVNGVGKTTTIGKLAANFVRQGKKVTLAAADTFRAAAIDQLQIWAERSGADIIKQNEGSDPAAVVFDAISSAKARGSDIIIADTAGRLHNKKNLMAELEKINRIIDRELPDSAKEVLLVLDATTGQNAVNQTKEFKNAAGITGIVLTKLDGTAKGGVVLAIKEELDVPVKYIGVGEQIDDLQPFDPEEFAKALFADDYDDEGEALSAINTAQDVAEVADSQNGTDDSIHTENTEQTSQTPAEEPLSEEDEWLRSWRSGEQDEPQETAAPKPVEKEKTKEKVERKAKKKFNWSTEPAPQTAEDDDWLKNWRENGEG